MKNRLPAFLSVILLLIVEIIHTYGRIPIQQSDFELISNFFLILIAVIGLFVTGLPSKKVENDNLICLLSNLTVSAISFPMNIDVFEHTIRLEQFWSDLWGWHLWWIIFAVVQILVLSTLGKNSFKQIHGFWVWVKNVIKQLGCLISGLLDSLIKIDKGVLFIMGLGIIVWAWYLYGQLHGNDIKEVFSDTKFLWNNVVFWVTYVMIGVLIYIIPSLVQNVHHAVGNAFSNPNPKTVLVILTVIVALIILPLVSPALWELLKIIIMILTAPATLYAVYRYHHSETQCSQNGNQKKHYPDIYVVLSAFIMPLIIVFFLGACTPKGSQLFASSDLSDATTIMEFLGVVADTANSILQLLGLK